MCLISILFCACVYAQANTKMDIFRLGIVSLIIFLLCLCQGSGAISRGLRLLEHGMFMPR